MPGTPVIFPVAPPGVNVIIGRMLVLMGGLVPGSSRKVGLEVVVAGIGMGVIGAFH